MTEEVHAIESEQPYPGGSIPFLYSLNEIVYRSNELVLWSEALEIHTQGVATRLRAYLARSLSHREQRRLVDEVSSAFGAREGGPFLNVIMPDNNNLSLVTRSMAPWGNSSEMRLQFWTPVEWTTLNLVGVVRHSLVGIFDWERRDINSVNVFHLDSKTLSAAVENARELFA